MKSSTILVVGAGVAGICAAVKLKTDLNCLDFTIVDENADFGGVWLVHTYPACGCDIPVHLYSYSFEQNPDWTKLFVSQSEILQYLQNIAKKYDLYSNAKFNHVIRGLEWDEDIKKWRVLIFNKTQDICRESFFDFVIAGPGLIRVPHIPDKFKEFQGPFMHSAQWDHTTELEGKVVGVIGSGASALQIVPAIVHKAKALLSFQRRPAWILPRPQVRIPSLVKKVFTVLPWIQKVFRWTIFIALDIGFSVLRKDNFMNKLAACACQLHLRCQLPNNLELWEKLKPVHTLGSKTLSLSSKFYPTFALPNVQVIRDSIQKVQGKTIVTENGNEYNVDVLILATGYKVDYLHPAKLLGKNLINVKDEWKLNGVSHYLGIATTITPNMFLIRGPNTVSFNNSNIFPIECQVNWVIKVMKKMLTDGFQVVQVCKEAEEAYMNQVHESLSKTVINSDYDFCRKSESLLFLHCSAFTYWSTTQNVNFDHLKFDS